MLLIITKGKPSNLNQLAKLYETLQTRDIPYKIISSPDPNIIKRKDIQGIIIPGGGIRIKSTSIQTELYTFLYYLYHFSNIPILGLCLGCQILMTWYGGDIEIHDTFWIRKTEIDLDLSRDKIFHGEERDQKLHVHFHDLPCMTPKAKKAGVREIAWIKKFRDGKRRACAFEFEKNRVYGFMFHPESNKETRSILYNFYDKVCSGTS